MEAVWAAVGRDVPNVAVGGVLAAALRLNPSHERRQVDRERPGEPVDVDHAHIPASTLDVADVARVESRLLRETFLREPTLQP